MIWKGTCYELVALEKNLATVCQDLPSLSKSCQDYVRS